MTHVASLLAGYVYHTRSNYCNSLNGKFKLFVNLRHMCEGYGRRSVLVSVYLSVTTLAATYLVYEPNLRCYKVPYGVPNA